MEVLSPILVGITTMRERGLDGDSLPNISEYNNYERERFGWRCDRAIGI